MSDDTSTTDAPEAEPEAPRDERRDAIVAQLVDALGDAVIESHVEAGRDIWVRVATEAWAETASVARNGLGARYFGFVSAIDWMPSPFGRSMDSDVDKVLEAAREATAEADAAAEDSTDGEAGSGLQRGVCGGETRFQVFARVASIGVPGEHWGITLKADVPDDAPAIETWTATYAGADWHERETWEMFGIDFVGHPGLRNMYLPTDFEGNPLRKDFPLLARMVKPWPGIVDVEPLPTDDDDDEDES